MKLCVFELDTVCANDIATDALAQFGKVSFHPKYLEAEKVIEAIGDSEIVLCSKVEMTREVMEACPNLKYIGLTATGYNNVDTDAAKELGIVVTNVPGYSTDAVCQMTLAYLFQFATNLIAYDKATKNGEWISSPIFCYTAYPMMELKGKTLGLLGLGNIGNQVASIARILGMNVIYHSREEKEVPYDFVSKETLFHASDFLSLHCPLVPETEKVVNRKTLGMMKKTAYLINTARGGLIDEKALATALNKGRIAGFAGDVLTVEPQSEDCPLRNAKNCILTPHVAWAPYETRVRLFHVILSNIDSFLKKNPQNVVNP